MTKGRPLEGKFVIVAARQPSTVCCAEALLATGLMTMGVEQHPGFPFTRTVEEQAGEMWRWVFCDRSKCGTYSTEDLVRWWYDPNWRLAHPTHEWAITMVALQNQGVMAAEIRKTEHTVVVRRGLMEAHIPTSATAEDREWLLNQLEGRGGERKGGEHAAA